MRIALGILAALVSVSAANAADPYVRPTLMTAPAPFSNWTGMYLGGFAGGSWVDAKYCAAFAGCASFSPSGFVGGAYFGYDYELPNRFVVGAKLSVPLGSIDNTTPVLLPGPPGRTIKGDLKWAAAANAVIGYDMGAWLPYIGLGVIWASNEVTVTAPSGATGTDQQLHPGLNFLAGVKYMVARSWAVGVQYNHSEFASETYVQGLPVVFTGTGSFSQNSVVGTIEYRF
jgi:outer membrane immunogenic protein